MKLYCHNGIIFISVALLKKLDLPMIEKVFFQKLDTICNHTILYGRRTIPVHSNYTDILDQLEFQTLSFKPFKTVEELQPV